ncbi:MAG: Unknown protein [uncultured Sulfurovum sp.]|uniref:Uncharacterized protein n=1 Tax=uncultured Sulfurovum sp. TaxID=269237 RepID=A0A6S6SBP2_9BACT|nr:MAG: Unknown protein [uncultured Sulfurovum sp.]
MATTQLHQKLLLDTLQTAINKDDFNLVKQAIEQGANPKSLFISSILNLGSTKILQLLLENGFNIHADKNMVLTEWMGSTVISGWGNKRHERHDLLAFIAHYYLEKPASIAKFKSLRLPDKSLLFKIGLNNNNLEVMKFALLIGTDKNEALNSALYRYYSHEQIKHKHEKVDYEIIEYLLNSNIEFKKITISNAVCFKYTELLNALSHMHDLEYAYEMAFNYDNEKLLNDFTDRGVSKEAQHLAKMKVSAIKGNMKALRNAINNGANVEMLSKDIIVDIINKNQIESLKFLHNLGLLLDASFNQYLDQAMRQHKAYETISYLIELGLDITHVKNMPTVYKQKYPSLADMWEKRFTDIFDYTLHLAKEVYPKVEGKRQEEVLKRVAQLSSLPYVMHRSKEKLTH